MKKLVIIGLSLALSMSLIASAYSADTFKINFNKVVAYDDGDYKPDGAGEIYFSITVNSLQVYATKGRISLDDRGNDTKTLNFSRTFKGNQGDVVIEMSGNEYDKYSRNEKCHGTATVNKHRLQNQELDCGNSNGELGLKLYYYVEMIK